MKIEFVNGVPSWNKKWNGRHLWWREQEVFSLGTFQPAGSIDVELKENKHVITPHKSNHITIVKQPSVLKDAYVLIHELLHWMVFRMYPRDWCKRLKWNKKIDKYL